MESHTLRTLVGLEIRKQRELQDLSLHQLAAMAGTSYSHLWKVENAQTGVGIDLLCRISNALDIRLNEIFEEAYATYDEINDLAAYKALTPGELRESPLLPAAASESH